MAYQIYFENGQVFTVTGFSLLGRNPDLRIMKTAQLFILDDPTKTVSKTHLALAVNNLGQLVIEDIDSTNGTFVTSVGRPQEQQIFNGQPQVISPSDIVRVGDVLFRIRQI
ncbi:MAG: FHA domain-containing protein [Candidatus Ancillula sp.]|jgi:pSer/pThr/pTyr-binding forkhead associated (FHA) protein|nr:FHA domain-containing protein [Candidatus Ancillula sp.]